jgi:hypothetical protein
MVCASCCFLWLRAARARDAAVTADRMSRRISPTRRRSREASLARSGSGRL